MSYYNLPYIYERDGRSEKVWDIYSRLLKDRIIFIGVPINDYVANAIVAQLLFLQMEDSTKDIDLYINSPGGSITAGMAIYDTMNFISCNVNTYCIGMVASISTILVSAGSKRYSLPNSTFMLYQPKGIFGGQSSDISIIAKEILRWKNIMNTALNKHTGKPIEEIEKDSDRDYYMNAEDAKKYGIIDEIINNDKLNYIK